MAIYLVTGKLGTGKSKFCVGKAREAILAGRRVASNLDLELEHLVPSRAKARYYRLPDKPRLRDLEAIGHGNPDSYDEDQNGLLILDELGSWLNARQFADKDRQPVIDWLIHARKHGWDVLFIAQHAAQIDKQVRESLAEYLVTCYRLDKIPIPVLGQLLGIIAGKKGKLPPFHIAATKINLGSNMWHVLSRDFFLGRDLHKAYDTRQVFTDDPDRATYTRLSPFYFSARPRSVPWWKRLLASRPDAQRPAGGPGIAPRSKRPAVLGVIATLPPDLRIAEWKRLQRLGYV